MTDTRRALPSVGALLESAGVRALLASAPRSLVVDAVRATIAHARDDAPAAPHDEAQWADAIASRLAVTIRPSLRRTINATGIVLHTNLGRAPLAPVALDAIANVAAGYSNLEYDLDEGARGSRYVHCATLLRELTGAEDALVVNNCAAALVLALNTLADGRDAILSRGELVEIGGSFRVHEIMAKSGARLREVGATNRTHLADYERAVGPDTGALLKVHRSNFAVRGFTSEATVTELAPLAQRHGIPIVHDLGSGLLIALDSIGLSGEPTAREAHSAGATVVVMSGDKLLGGPQAGLIIGNHRWLDAMRKNPLARSYRVDKLTLSALEATLTLYREPERALREIPTLALLGTPAGELRSRAEALQASLARHGVASEVVETTGSVGAGAFPDTALPSAAVALHGDAERWARRLRESSVVAVIGRVHDGRLLIDLRAVSAPELIDLERAIAAANG
ncbi:MAG TPA: L-seryl-tRNA(Sec) selenium transferase [Gemmatimonadaceae bacterium]|jgi:L-seryl-tRNA(Ser) seleniumtransferase|nr:L-seryl-tRNA(Sec) selenium transferase [Gemmatimonadaceae bacterium]